MSLSPGTKISRYEILSLLGRGGMGDVYLAKDGKLGRKVALKVLKRTDDPDRVRRFIREARAASALNHPHILAVYDFGRHDEVHYIVSEYLEGKTLRRSISDGSVGLKQAFKYAVQIGDSLAAA